MNLPRRFKPKDHSLSMLTITTNYGETVSEVQFLIGTEGKTYGIFFENYRICCNDYDFRVSFNGADLMPGVKNRDATNVSALEAQLDIIRKLDFISIKSLTHSVAEELFPHIYPSNSEEIACFQIDLSEGNLIHSLCSNEHNGYYSLNVEYHNGETTENFDL